jgi:uncharacterized membrane protein
MNYNLSTKKKFGTRQLTMVGMLSGISIMLGLTGYGFIPLPLAKATIMHIPVIVGTLVEGPLVGMLVGLIFGIFSVFQNMTTPSALSFAFMNPLVSVLPRVLIAVTTYYSYKLMRGKDSIKIGVAAAIGSITNTFGVLTMVYILYAARFAEAKHVSQSLAAKTIYLGIAVPNGIPEAIIAVMITIPLVIAVKKIRK